MKCSRNACDREATSNGYCESDYRKRLRMGLTGFVDSGPTIAHVQKLRDLGWSYEAIGKASGICFNVYATLMRERYSRVRMVTEKATLAVPLERRETHRATDATGTQRRVRALSCMGWPTAEVARRAGVSYDTLNTEMWRGRLSHRIAVRIAKVYEELSHTEGPSAHARRRAKQLGFHPPFAWDYVDIDDPKARPYQGFARSA